MESLGKGKTNCYLYPLHDTVENRKMILLTILVQISSPNLNQVGDIVIGSSWCLKEKKDSGIIQKGDQCPVMVNVFWPNLSELGLLSSGHCLAGLSGKSQSQ